MPVNKIFILYFIASIHSAFCTNDGVKDENNNIVLKSIKKRKDFDKFNNNTYNISFNFHVKSQEAPKGYEGDEEDEEDFNYEKLKRFVFLEKKEDGNISLLNFVNDKK